ncbi:MAG: hypothetical protein KKE51_05715 [Gammaproteobacteria bacterium]|nr:hypothetical protein [Gammaproteobacteria bacterium]MBU2435721.1 hypothetical protein [Gammaproteobacteria bacterium]MBU2449498.1 hypothetical protein [Gammaproteobacteria bacterium]
MNATDRLFAEVWNRLTADWSRLTTFRKMGVLGEDAARDAMHQSNTYFIQNQLLHGEHHNFIKNRDQFIRDGMHQKMPQLMTESAVAEFRRTLNASTLVFSHSILDAAIFDCVRICALAAPAEWSEQLANRKVALGDVAKRPYSEFLSEAIEIEVSRLERESLLAKVDRVFQVCRPQKQEYLTTGFRFDRGRLRELDELRHRVVHAADGSWEFESIEDDMQFMQSSGLHIFSMVGECFGLVVSGEEAMAALAARRASVK